MATAWADVFVMAFLFLFLLILLVRAAGGQLGRWLDFAKSPPRPSGCQVLTQGPAPEIRGVRTAGLQPRRVRGAGAGAGLCQLQGFP